MIAFINSTGYSIQCYSCNSHHETDCSDVTKLEKFIVNCSAESSPVFNKSSSFCRKMLQTIDFKQNGRKLFIG